MLHSSNVFILIELFSVVTSRMKNIPNVLKKILLINEDTFQNYMNTNPFVAPNRTCVIKMADSPAMSSPHVLFLRLRSKFLSSLLNLFSA